MNSNGTAFGVRLLMLALGFMLAGSAQVPDPHIGPRGFIRLLNAVAVGEGKLEFLIDGRHVREEGYVLGDVTGGIPRRPGSYSMKFRREGIVDGETRLVVVKDETVTLIPFAEFVPATEKKPAHWIIRILRLRQSGDREKNTATFVNLTRKPEIMVRIQQPDESWNRLSVKRLGMERTSIQQRAGYVPIQTDGGDLKPLSVGTSGNFVSVIYEDSEGVIRSQNFQDLKYLSLE
jgi:hypothetical protein